ncbi:hypothetical protein WT49_01565 [Burkholderia territorii]|nr:hypothetical protein WT49_01565 [Burkholderia territorii]KWE31617.1 hypothetical protein WT50_30745 [Burkholderia territorii]KWE44757.1 hypothetical protein WT51_20200 [Burkholderia territorii]
MSEVINKIRFVLQFLLNNAIDNFIIHNDESDFAIIQKMAGRDARPTCLARELAAPLFDIGLFL